MGTCAVVRSDYGTHLLCKFSDIYAITKNTETENEKIHWISTIVYNLLTKNALGPVS